MLRFLAAGVAIAALLSASAEDAAPAFAPGNATPSALATKDLLLAVTDAGSRLVAVGEFGHIIYSDDNGKTWTQAERVPTQATLTSVDFADEKNGWAAGHDRVIVATTDGGKTWALQYSLDIATARGDRMPMRLCPAPQEVPLPPAPGLEDEFAQPPTTEGDCTYPDFEADSMGGPDSFAGIVFNWAGPLIPKPPEKDVPFLGIVFTSATHGFAVGGFSTTLETKDGGKTWMPRRLVQTAADDYHFNGAIRGADQSIFIPAERGQIVRSKDDGATWDVVSGLIETDAQGNPVMDEELGPDVPKVYQGSFWGGFPRRDGSVAIVGMRGNIWVSANQGDSWARIGAGATPEPLNGGVELADGTLIVTGNGGAVLRSADGGKSFDTALSRPDRKAIATAAGGETGQLILFGEFGVDTTAMTAAPGG